MSLPIFKDENTNMMLMQTKWASQLNPVLANAVINGQVLKGISLVPGTNTINHKLGRKMQGWFITDINGPSTIYRSQPMNNQTLTLNSSGLVTVDILVY